MAKYKVRAELQDMALSNVRTAARFSIRRGGRILGRLRVGLGSIQWFPAGATKPKTIPWGVFADMIGEWPFGASVRGKLKFRRDALYWVAPGQRGAGRRIEWPAFARCMAECK